MRFYRILLNIFSSTSRTLVGLVLGVIATPIILKNIGEENFGAFRVLMDWMGHLGILEFGLFQSLLIVFAKALSDKSEISVKTVYKAAFKKYFWVITYQFLGLGLLFFFIDDLIPMTEGYKKDLHRAFFISGISLLFAYSQIYRAYLEASQKGYILSTIMIVQNVTLVTLSVLLAILGWGITGQAIAFTVSIGLSFFILYLKTRKSLKKDAPTKNDGENVDSALKRQRGPNFIATICGRASLVSDNLIIAAFLSAKTVTAFYLTQRLLQIAMGQLQQISNATWPAMIEIYHQKQTENFSKKILEVTEFIAFIAGMTLTVLCFINPPFVILWTGEATFAGLTLSNIVLYNVGLIGIISFWQWCFSGTGLVEKIIPLLVVQTIVNVGLSIFLTTYLGILGPVIGTFVSFQFVTLIWQSYLLNKIFNVPLLALTKSWVVPMALPLCIAIATSYYLGPIPVQNWLELILLTSVTGFIVLCSFPFLFVRKEIRSQFIDRFKRLILKRFK